MGKMKQKPEEEKVSKTNKAVRQQSDRREIQMRQAIMEISY